MSIYKKDGTKIIQDEFQLYGTNYHTRSYNFAKDYSFYKEKETIHIWIKGKDDKEEIYKYNTLTGEKIN